MFGITQLIAAIAFVYAVITLFVVLTYWTSQVSEGFLAWREKFVERSVRFYRLLLAAYPASFRNEYGEVMVQLFRDTARDAFRRRGLLGLAAMWPRTLADLTISAIRQHQDKPVEVNSESVLLRDFLQKWRRFGSEALSVTTFSTWYALHLLRLYFQRAVLVWATLAVIAFGIWFSSFFDSFRVLRLNTSRVDLGGGVLRIWHVYDVGEPISNEQWLHDIRAWYERNRSLGDRFYSPVPPWEFSYFTDIPGNTPIQWRTTAPDRLGMVRREPVLVRPYKYWQLRFPFGILPVLLLGWTIRVYLRRSADSATAMQSA